MSLKWEIIRDNLNGSKKTARAISADTNLPLHIVKGCLTFFKKQGVFGLSDDRLWYFIKEPVGRQNNRFSCLEQRKSVSVYVFNRMKFILDVIKANGGYMSKAEIASNCNIYCDIRYDLSFLEKNGFIVSRTRNFHEKEYCATTDILKIMVKVENHERELTNE